MITDEKFVNTIKLIALKNAIEFENKIKLDVVISRAFSFSKFLPKGNAQLKNYIPHIKTIVLDLETLSLEKKKELYNEIVSKGNDYLEENRKEDRKNKSKDIQSVGESPRDGDSASPAANDYKSKEQQLVFELPDLAGAIQGKVVTRFPPEPNGYPHIGHAKAAVIDEEYAKKYDGKLILRYDDTNPIKEKIEYYDAIKEGLDWLEVKPQIIKNTSDDIEKLYEYARKLIQKNFAYVCNCAPEIIKKNRINSVACNCTFNSVDDNMKYFDDMPYEQISEITDTSVGALKASYHHAVKKIEDYLSE